MEGTVRRAFLAMGDGKTYLVHFDAESYAGCSPEEGDDQAEQLESDVDPYSLKDSEEEIAGGEDDDEGAAHEEGVQGRTGPSYLAVVRLL